MSKPQVVPNAQWKPTDHTYPQWTGVCQKCGQTVPAVTLVPKRLPFGRGEIWACKQGC